MTTPFMVIVPKDITDANFVSSTIPETDYAVWSAGTAYTLGQRVIMTTGIHKVYEALASSTGVNPSTDTTGKWVLVGPTNRWSMFDTSGGTVSAIAGNTIEFVFTADRLSSMGFLDVAASTIRIRATASATTYYDTTFTLPDRAVILNWYDYFNAEAFRTSELIVTDIPPIAGSTYTVTITNTGGNCSIGSFISGNFTEIGNTQYGASAGIIDYSVKNVDAFGTSTITKRAFSKRIDVKVHVGNAVIDAVRAKLNSLRATVCLWAGSSGNYELLTVYGFYKDYSIDIAYPTYSVLSLQIEGLI